MDENRIEKLIAEATEAGLEGLDFLRCFGLAEIVGEYNGIGPEWAGALVRAVVTEKLAVFEPAALIHDLRNAVSDGTEFCFRAANTEFLHNCLALADRAHPWWSWKRYRARLISHALYDFVSSPGGWLAWIEAHEKNLSRQGLRPPSCDESCKKP